MFEGKNTEDVTLKELNVANKEWRESLMKPKDQLLVTTLIHDLLKTLTLDILREAREGANYSEEQKERFQTMAQEATNAANLFLDAAEGRGDQAAMVFVYAATILDAVMHVMIDSITGPAPSAFASLEEQLDDLLAQLQASSSRG